VALFDPNEMCQAPVPSLIVPAMVPFPLWPEHASFHHKRDQTESEDPSNPHARFHSFPPTETANDWHKFVAEMRRKLVEWSLQKPRALELIPLRGTTRHAVSVICSAGRVADA
jgi:hypothetical protein